MSAALELLHPGAPVRIAMVGGDDLYGDVLQRLADRTRLLLWGLASRTATIADEDIAAIESLAGLSRARVLAIAQLQHRKFSDAPVYRRKRGAP